MLKKVKVSKSNHSNFSSQPSNYSSVTSADSVIALMPNVLKVNLTTSLDPSTFLASPVSLPPDLSLAPELVVTLITNFLKVFLENGQTKSFKYDSSTTVQVIVKIQIKIQFHKTTYKCIFSNNVLHILENFIPGEFLFSIILSPLLHYKAKKYNT